MTRNDQKLIKRVYKTQKENPSLGDFVELVKNYFEMIEMNLDEDSISEMSRDAFKKHSKSKVREAALKHLKSIQEGHSKVRGIKYSSLETQKYLTSPLFTNKECDVLFAIRSYTLRGIKGNTPSIHKDNMLCLLKCDSTS